MKNPFARLAAPALLITAVAGAAPAPEPKGDGQPHAIPGGVTDEDGAKGFVANDKGGVTALDLATGEVLWESKTAGQPVSVLGGWVWVQARDKDKANVLHVIGLKLDDGKAATQSDPIVLPKWADATPGEGAGHSFSSHAWTNKKDGLLMIAWQADTFYWGGRQPPPEVLKAAQKHADGVAQVNLSTNEVQMLETAKAPPIGPKVSDKLRNAAARNYGDDKPTVAVAGDYAVAVDLEPAGAVKQKAVLKRWELATEKPLDPVVLTDASGPYQVVTLPSGGVTLVRDTATPPGPSPDEATWAVYALATGKQTAPFTSESAATDFTAVGPRVFYVAKQWFKGPMAGGGGVLPRTLKAVDLKTGKHLWEQPLEGERQPPSPPR